MANNLNENLKGRYVVIKADAAPADRRDTTSKRVLKVTDGNGTDPNGMGVTVFGQWADDPAQHLQRFDGRQDLERFASPDELAEAQGRRQDKVGW